MRLSSLRSFRFINIYFIKTNANSFINEMVDTSAPGTAGNAINPAPQRITMESVGKRMSNDSLSKCNALSFLLILLNLFIF